MPSKLSPTPFPSIPDSSYKNGILDEVTLLDAANTTKFGLHELGIIPTRVIIQKKLTFQHFFLMDAPVHTLDTIPLHEDC